MNLGASGVQVEVGTGRVLSMNRDDEVGLAAIRAWNSWMLEEWHGAYPERFIPMLNAAMSPTFYEFDSGDLLKLYREMDDRDEEPVVIYHSHTATEAHPSRTDISYANEPGAHYVLVSTADTDGLGEFQFRSFRIVDGEVTEEEVKIVEAY